MYVESIEGVSTNLATMFSNLENQKTTLAFLVSQFVVDVVKDGCPVQKPIVTQTTNMEADLLDLKQDVALKSVHQSQSTVQFWKQVSVGKYPALRQTSQQLLNMSVTTYCYESMHSAMKYVKSKHGCTL